MSPSLSGIVDIPLPPAPVTVPVSPIRKKKKYSIQKFPPKSRGSSSAKKLVAGLCRRLDDDLGSTAGGFAGDASPLIALSSVATVRSLASSIRKGRSRVLNGDPRPRGASGCHQGPLSPLW
ncbi:hypothetical protein D1007_47269 [Hordeum vulgare]|nr:hypothetical protein D1007_47269 [Hordeum vulgare]